MKLAGKNMDTIIAESAGMQQVMLMGETFAQKDVSHILITGDSGTGKWRTNEEPCLSTRYKQLNIQY